MINVNSYDNVIAITKIFSWLHEVRYDQAWLQHKTDQHEWLKITTYVVNSTKQYFCKTDVSEKVKINRT
jgi:hypothetical protein